MIKNFYKIDDLFDLIKSYSKDVHTITFRYGIDYIKCDPYLKEKYPETFQKLEEYFIPRKVTFIYSNNDNKNIIECGNKYELETMIGIPKSDFGENINGETIIKNLEWVMLEKLTDVEISQYKDKLKLKIILKNYGWLDNPMEEIFNIIYKDKDIIIPIYDFINKLIFDDDFNKQMGIEVNKIGLTLEDRLEIADKFNPLIREDCLSKINGDKHEWLDTLSVIPKEKLKIKFENKEFELYN